MPLPWKPRGKPRSLGSAGPLLRRTPCRTRPGDATRSASSTSAGGLYGFVTGTHYAAHRNNPATPWNEHDAVASCMVLNQNFGPFPGTPTNAMRATVAHEFNHSIQFGYGALSGFGNVDDVFVEGGATWMEDEVFDTSNDNYNYLWPSFTTPMGKYAKFPYPYWIVFRAMTERFGTGTANGGMHDLPHLLGAALQGSLDRIWQRWTPASQRRVRRLPRPITTRRSPCGSSATALRPPGRIAWRKRRAYRNRDPWSVEATCSASAHPARERAVRSPTTSPSTGWACRP